MPAHIEDYALLGNCRSAALVSREGSLDWLCLPRFDAPSVFAALLGNEEHGRWRLAPCDPVEHTSRQYLEDTLVLETTWVTASGRARVLDLMPLGEVNSVVRIVEGLADRSRRIQEYAGQAGFLGQTRDQRDLALHPVEDDGVDRVHARCCQGQHGIECRCLARQGNDVGAHAAMALGRPARAWQAQNCC